MFIEEENFWYQYKFRRSSIGFIFSKEFFSNVLMLCIMILINYQYLIHFNMANFKDYQNNISKI